MITYPEETNNHGQKIALMFDIIAGTVNDRQNSVETFVHKRKLNGSVPVPIEHHSKLLFRRLAASYSINIK